MNKARTLYTFRRLEMIEKDSDPRPKFVFAHILCPHPPYVFNRVGEMPEPRMYRERPRGSHDWYPKERYVDQIHYLNFLVTRTIDRILRSAKQRPIIILQGDHGAACDGTSANPTPLMVRERMSILNAYLVPPKLRARLYPSITPVNTFRILGDFLFQTQFPPVPDRSYYSGPMDVTPYKFVDVREFLPEEMKRKN